MTLGTTRESLLNGQHNTYHGSDHNDSFNSESNGSVNQDSHTHDDNIVHKLPPLEQVEDGKHPRYWCGLHFSSQDHSLAKEQYNYAIQTHEKEKTPMCRIAEISRYNKLKHEYRLMDESGPAHKKLFTVELILSSHESYSGCGESIKKAQQAAAAEALSKTQLPRPPTRIRGKKNKKDCSSPPVLLSHVCRSLGLADPVYNTVSLLPASFITMPPFSPVKPQDTRNGWMCPNFYPPNYIPNMELSYGIYLRNNGCMLPGAPTCALLTGGSSRLKSQVQPHPIPQPHPSARFVSTLVLGAEYPVLSAHGETKILARANVAIKGLDLLRPSMQELEGKIREQKALERRRLAEEAKERAKAREQEEKEAAERGQGEEEDEMKREQRNGGRMGKSPKHKSVISQLHECALARKLTVEFEVVQEEGRAHERKYAVICRLASGEGPGTIEAVGEGKQKKEAKKAACAQVLQQLNQIETSPIYIASSIYKNQKRFQLPLREIPKRKTISKEMKMDPSYGHQINPVSRLIQVMQTRGVTEPKFEEVAEIGQYKGKQFGVIVTCGGLQCEGQGPNKRLAKRAAAEAMLVELGCAKPLPEPGKSLLKKKEKDQDGSTMMNIGMFDPSEFMAKPIEPIPPVVPGAIAVRMTPLNLPPPAGKVAPPAKVVESPIKAPPQSTRYDYGVELPSRELRIDSATEQGSGGDSWSPEPNEEDLPYPKSGLNASPEPKGEEDQTRELRVDSSSSSRAHSTSPNDCIGEAAQQRRRVTFSSQVAACPAPDDSSYPKPELAPLKSEMTGKMRRRGKDAKRKSLTESQKEAMRSSCMAFLKGDPPEADNVFRIESLHGAPPPGGTETAQQWLERMAAAHRFSIHFTNLQVCHGVGLSLEEAHENAALNAIKDIAGVREMPLGMAPPVTRVLPALCPSAGGGRGKGVLRGGASSYKNYGSKT